MTSRGARDVLGKVTIHPHVCQVSMLWPMAGPARNGYCSALSVVWYSDRIEEPGGRSAPLSQLRHAYCVGCAILRQLRHRHTDRSGCHIGPGHDR